MRSNCCQTKLASSEFIMLLGLLALLMPFSAGNCFPGKHLLFPRAGRGVLLSMLGLSSSSNQIEVSSKSTTQKDERSIDNDIQFPFQDFLEEADQHAQKDQLLDSARIIRRVMSNSDMNFQLASRHQKILCVADRIEGTILDLNSPPDPKIWTKVREVHDGKRDILVHYRLDDNRRLTGRIEFLIEKSLLVPILAVLVETELYNTWVPRWHFPPVGIKQVRKLVQTGRTNQVLHADLEIPWKRDIIIASTGIEDVHENGLLGIHLGPLPAGNEIGDTGVRVPIPEPGVERVEFEGCFVFHKCPDHHPVLGQYLAHAEEGYEEMILVGFSLFVDAKLSPLFPQWIANFIIRIAMVRLFRIFISVAEDVHAGKRPDHTAAIARKRSEIYDWIDARVTALLRRKDV